MRNLVLIGGGGHCKSVIDVAESAGFSIIGILDRPEEVGKTVLGYEVIGTDEDLVKFVDKAEFLITVGQIKSPQKRIDLFEMVKRCGGKLATIISPTSYVSKYATIGEGTIIMHKALLNADVVVGKNTIINTMANVGHDVKVGDHCHISTGVMLCGNSKVGNSVFIGSQSVVNQGIEIDCGVIGSLSVVNKNIKENGIYAGSPVRLVRQL